MSIRTERVAGEIQKSLAEILQQDFSYLYDGLLTVTTVRVTPDLRHCKAYISLISKNASRDQSLLKIQKETPRIRMALAHSVRMRYVPELHFYLDDTQDEVDRIEHLFKEIHRREDQHKDRE
ncbi:MAG TPA: 30S ribosome-binding factor RbfA [Candidatus Kapabacteria bacterium]|nr:30S ribosome-binding factor RbfA [Candidatus Kapabacteria bacterium]